MENKESLIHILTNPSFPSYVKIGKTTNLKQRIKNLNNPTCLPFSFQAYATYKVENNLDAVERSVHKLIDIIDYELRAREKTDTGKNREREFFAINAETAYEILREIAFLREDEHNLTICKQTKEEKREEEIAQSVASVAERTDKFRPFKFSEYGIEIGSELIFIRDPSIKVKVVSEKQIEYQGKHYSLSGLAYEILVHKFGRKPTTSARGPYYFSYNSKRLTDIRNDSEE